MSPSFLDGASNMAVEKAEHAAVARINSAE
jgi:hypothetical protein